VLEAAKQRGAMTIAWPGDGGRADYAVAAPSADPHVHQEIFELLGHTMYESVHVFLEHFTYRESTPAQGGTGVDFNFLYPFLDSQTSGDERAIDEVAASIRMKGRDAGALREQVASRQCERIAQAAAAIRERLACGGRILAFGNGGSATDATDFALDCVMPEHGWTAIPALSLALEPAVITATANDVGVDVVFLRQLIAQSRSCDVAMAFSTSGGSANVVAALIEARKRGLLTIALLGYDGGEIARRGLADIALVVDCDYVPRIQEAQGTIYHVLREALARA
jgi:D-sedoheptulose 7-phosphate isomerase